MSIPHEYRKNTSYNITYILFKHSISWNIENKKVKKIYGKHKDKKGK
jgi:hypothetical protein